MKGHGACPIRKVLPAGLNLIRLPCEIIEDPLPVALQTLSLTSTSSRTMLRQTCLLCAVLSFAACTTPTKPAQPPARVHTGEIIGGLKLDSSGHVERQLNAREVEELRRRDLEKNR